MTDNESKAPTTSKSLHIAFGNQSFAILKNIRFFQNNHKQ